MTVLAVLLAMLAPAPKEKPLPPPPVIVAQSCVMTWHGVDCETSFHADGFFYCLWHGRSWNGQWECKGGVLTVTEWPWDEPHRRSTWTVKLRCKASGNFAGGTAWKIVPLAGKVH